MPTLWKHTWYPGRAPKTTADAGYSALIEYEGGQVERAASTAEAAAEAVSELTSILYERGLLHDDEVVKVLRMQGYERTED